MTTTPAGKASPGPWHLSIGRCTGRKYLYDVNGRLVCTLEPCDDGSAAGEARWRKDSDLLAGASGLLEACRKARTCQSIPDCVQDVLRVAIAKATGKDGA